MIKFSFLISLYNGEKFITRALESILSQDIPQEEFEIICIDDCSPDCSSEIVEMYQKQHNNIRLYRNKTNCRMATNLNHLVEYAQGEYFWVIGQDDFIEPNCLGKIYSNLKADNLDVLTFNYRRVDEAEKLINEPAVFSNSECLKGTEWLKTQFAARDYTIYMFGYEWRAIYKTEYWKKQGIRCIDGMNYEDTVIMMQAIIHSNKVKSVSDIFYNYRENLGSITSYDKIEKKGTYIFEFAFLVGFNLELFYDEIRNIDIELAEKMHHEISDQYNNFAFDLMRTSWSQKKVFYQELAIHKGLVDSKLNILNWKSKLLINPIIGLLVLTTINMLYNVKKKITK